MLGREQSKKGNPRLGECGLHRAGRAFDLRLRKAAAHGMDRRDDDVGGVVFRVTLGAKPDIEIEAATRADRSQEQHVVRIDHRLVRGWTMFFPYRTVVEVRK